MKFKEFRTKLNKYKDSMKFVTKEGVDLDEATLRVITLDWDMGDPREYQADWQDIGVYLDDWNKRKMEISISGTDKALLQWLVDDYGIDKKLAQQLISKGKKIKESVDATELREKKVTINIDWIDGYYAVMQSKDAEKKFKVKIKVNNSKGTAVITGDNKAIVKLLTDPDIYGWPKSDVLDLFPQLK